MKKVVGLTIAMLIGLLLVPSAVALADQSYHTERLPLTVTDEGAAAGYVLRNGMVVIAAGGTGHPFFTTDTAAALRAIELDADVFLKATRVDGVYTGDPEKDRNAQRIEKISYIDVIKEQLRVMDLTAVSLCMDNGLPVIVFNLFEKNSLKNILEGKDIGTIIS